MKGSFRITMTLQEVNEDSYFELESITRSKVMRFESETQYNVFLSSISESFSKYINEMF